MFGKFTVEPSLTSPEQVDPHSAAGIAGSVVNEANCLWLAATSRSRILEEDPAWGGLSATGDFLDGLRADIASLVRNRQYRVGRQLADPEVQSASLLGDGRISAVVREQWQMRVYRLDDRSLVSSSSEALVWKYTLEPLPPDGPRGWRIASSVLVSNTPL